MRRLDEAFDVVPPAACTLADCLSHCPTVSPHRLTVSLATRLALVLPSCISCCRAVAVAGGDTPPPPPFHAPRKTLGTGGLTLAAAGLQVAGAPTDLATFELCCRR
jgi:hypothetical protein